MKNLDDIANSLKRFCQNGYDASIESIIFQAQQKDLFKQMETILQNHKLSNSKGHFHQAVSNYFGEKTNKQIQNHIIKVPIFEDKIDVRIQILTTMIEQLQRVEQITYKDINYYILLCDSFLIIQLNNSEIQQYSSLYQDNNKVQFLLQYLKNSNPRQIIEKSLRLRQTLNIDPIYEQNYLTIYVTSLNINEIEDQKNAIIVPLLNNMYVVGNHNDPYLQVEQQQDAEEIIPQSLYFELFWQFENLYQSYYNIIIRYINDRKNNYTVNILDYFNNHQSNITYPKIIQLVWIIEQIIKLEIMIQKYIVANITGFNYDPKIKYNSFSNIINTKEIIPNLQNIISCQINSQQRLIQKQIKDYKEQDKNILFYEYYDSQFNYAYNSDYGLIVGALVFNINQKIKIKGQIPIILENDQNQIFKLLINVKNEKIITISNQIYNNKEIQNNFYQFLGYIVYDQIKKNSIYDIGSEQIVTL